MEYGGQLQAFSSVHVIRSLAKGRPATQVNCIELWDDALWIGTTDGYVIVCVSADG